MRDQREILSWGILLDEIPPEGLIIDFDNFEASERGLKTIKPFSGHLRIKKLGYEVEVKGSLKGSVELTCDRCLEIYEYPIEENFEVLLLPNKSLNIEGERELEHEDMDVSFYEESFIAFGDILLEEILLALPFRKLCSSDCKGLCPSCGANLNKEKCQCKIYKKTSPFAALKDLLSKGENTVIKEG